ncbi:hypothetical protein CJU90_2039 [Yarrowia sp. C11]|nr:hypothetical protein CJU90_2039 [Yarrowia sp. C11]
MSYSAIPSESEIPSEPGIVSGSSSLHQPSSPRTGLIQNFIFLQVKKSIAIAVALLVSQNSSRGSHLESLLILTTAILPFWTPPKWTPNIAPHKFTAIVFYTCWLLQLGVQFLCMDFKPANQHSRVLIISALNLITGFLGNQIKYSQAYFVKRLYPAEQQVRVTKFAFLFAFVYPQLVESVLVALYLNTSIFPDWALEVFRAAVYLYFAADLYFRYPVESETGSVEWNDSSLYEFYKTELASVWKGVLFYYYFFLQFL